MDDVVTGLGIDPGLGGAWALVRRDGSAAPRLMASGEMPTRPGPAKRRRLDAAALWHTLRAVELEHGPIRVAVLEEPSAMPKQGISSAFGFGRTLGATEAVLIGMGWPIELVSPSVWKRAMHVPAAKDGARARATQMMPASAGAWARAKDDGLAEAVMLAVFGLDRVAPLELFA